MKLDHIGIAVKSLKDSLQTYTRDLGFEVVEIVTIEEQGVKIAVLPRGESCIELMEPTRSDSPVARFLEKRGEGVHHLCFRVEDIEARVEELKGSPIKVIHETPCLGLRHRKVSFLHPKSTHGVLIELVEESASDPLHAGETRSGTEDSGL
ncbi:MAG: methylmalonyl-CoA epimerase [Terriglobia bacterium]